MAGLRTYVLIFALVLGLTIATCIYADKPRSVSTSRQFLVYGAEVALRGAVCNLAEQTKANLLHLLQQRDNWKTPLLINLDFPQANYPDAPPARLEVSQLGYGLKLQLNLLVTREIRARETQRELLRAILIEMIYRDRENIAAGVPYVSPPDWLLDGVLRLQPGQDQDESAQLLQTVVSANKIAPLENVVRQKRDQLDTASRRLFEAYSQALVQLLLEAPDGRKKLMRYLRDLPDAPNDAWADLRVHFPEALGRAAAKWWSLSVAQLSATGRHELLSATETAKQLDRLLHFSILGRDGKVQEYSLGDHLKFRRLPGAREVLKQVEQQLLLLSARAHPSYRPIVEENCEIAELLASGKTRQVRPRLDRLVIERAAVDRRTQEIDDYMNWFEATQLTTMSGAFADLLKDPDAAEASLARRRDPISVYLDSIEQEVQ